MTATIKFYALTAEAAEAAEAAVRATPLVR